MCPGPPVVAQGATKISAAHILCAILSGARRASPGSEPLVGWGGVCVWLGGWVWVCACVAEGCVCGRACSPARIPPYKTPP